MTKGLHLVHFMLLLCRPTPSQCFILSVFKGICGSPSCCAFVAGSCSHCVKRSAPRGLAGWWRYWISKQRQTTLNCLKLIFMISCLPSSFPRNSIWSIFLERKNIYNCSLMDLWVKGREYNLNVVWLEKTNLKYHQVVTYTNLLYSVWKGRLLFQSDGFIALFFSSSIGL